MSKYASRFILALLLAITACDPYAQDEYREQFVVESYLVSEARMPEIRLTRTLPLFETYEAEEAAVTGAQVHIEELGAAGETSSIYTYRHDSTGIYRTRSDNRVKAERRYRLVAEMPGGETLRSESLVPGEFESVGETADTAVYQSERQIAITTTPSYYPGRQTYYIFTVVVENPKMENLTPFYRDAVSDADDPEKALRQYAKNSSGIINEKNYERDEDGNITLRLPWLAVAFYGKNNIVANAIDDNMYDFLRSQSVQTGGPTISPGEIQNIRYNVEGGIGIFGSLASDTVSVYIERE